MTVRITENLSIDLDREDWCCVACGHRLAKARENYKTGCMVAEVPMEEAHPPMLEGAAVSFMPNPDFCRLVEFYCPNCGTVLENEYVPPGHPLTHDIELDIDALKARRASGSAS
ncbi:acetone carboxylase subunit gamma [Antarcticimicrobium sediminis]|uniref:Acetophenone carboxylase n=1 Tax=Antarcticimicrobium sediminis TaxID=2546227 RepID=A0A4R5EP79_9RHOB|nr:acetone carboxylase subunit gamma [Antarcticimicrobium sediminis]TDE36303.1 acetophenone carboxylase [Antarcticimicrobium sediminis]